MISLSNILLLDVKLTEYKLRDRFLHWVSNYVKIFQQLQLFFFLWQVWYHTIVIRLIMAIHLKQQILLCVLYLTDQLIEKVERQKKYVRAIYHSFLLQLLFEVMVFLFFFQSWFIFGFYKTRKICPLCHKVLQYWSSIASIPILSDIYFVMFLNKKLFYLLSFGASSLSLYFHLQKKSQTEKGRLTMINHLVRLILWLMVLGLLIFPMASSMENSAFDMYKKNHHNGN